MVERDGDTAFWSKVQQEEVPHCGLCDPDTRHVELDDGRIGRCPRCWPPHADKPHAPRPHELLPQYARCGTCHALIYRHERGLPCSVHRTVADWHRAYDEAQAGQVPLTPSPVTATGVELTRTLLAARPLPERPVPPESRLTGEALAAAQLAESRARRAAAGEPEPEPEDEPEDYPDDGDDPDDDWEPPF